MINKEDVARVFWETDNHYLEDILKAYLYKDLPVWGYFNTLYNQVTEAVSELWRKTETLIAGLDPKRELNLEEGRRFWKQVDALQDAYITMVFAEQDLRECVPALIKLFGADGCPEDLRWLYD